MTDPQEQTIEELATAEQPVVVMKFTLPKGASVADAEQFGKELMGHVRDWHNRFEPGEPSIDLTSGAIL